MFDIADTAWAGRLERICQDGLITAVFQPIVDLPRGVICGYEALARFPPDLADAEPQQWFAAAALHGFSSRLEATALSVILADRSHVPAGCFLSVNLSPDALLSADVQAVLSSLSDLGGLVVEITEQTPVEDYGALGAVLDGLRERGAMVAVDDTGAGYASLSHLLALRPEFVKLDRSLVSGVDRDPRRAAAVRAIGAFSSELDAWMVAEGVEREAELERLIELEVPLVQGYLLGHPEPPMPRLPGDVVRMLRRQRRAPTPDRLSAIARPAPVVHDEPDVIAEATILVLEDGRPWRVLVPAGGRRAGRHPAMCVVAGEGIRDVALRAVARQSEDRYSPVCLCNLFGRPLGLITIESLLESLARGPEIP